MFGRLTSAFLLRWRRVAIAGANPIGKEIALSAYELMYIVKPDLDDQAVQQEIEKVGQLIQTNGGQVKKVTPWGKRRLAYTVKENREGHYVVAEFDLEQAKVQEVERVLKISDTVFRHLLVRQDEGKS